MTFSTSHGRRTRRVAHALVLAATVFLSLVFAQVASAATPTHGFPRTFHRWGGWADAGILAKYDLVVGYDNYDISYLRSQNPDGIYLLSPEMLDGTDSLMFVSYGRLDLWKGGCDNYAGGVNVGCPRPFDPKWDLLYNANGTVASVGGTYGHSGYNLADPTGKGTAELVAKVWTWSAKRSGLYTKGWDGIETDNWIYGSLGASWFYGSSLDADRDGKVDDYGTLRRQWADGLNKLGHLVRSYLPGKIVGGNGQWYQNPSSYYGSEPEGWLRSSNYTMIENSQQFYNNPDGFISTARRWLDYPDPYGQPRYLAVHQDALTDSGSTFSGDANGDASMLNPGVMRSMRWGLTLAMMADAYYMVGVSNKHASRWWYDEYDGGEGIRRGGYLGKALGAPVKLSNGIYRRDFENGIALNNSTGSTLTVSLGGTFKKLKGTQNPTLNDGALVTSVTIPGHDGIILLRTTAATVASVTAPVVSGTPEVSRALTVSNGTWSTTSGLTYTYQWQRCDAQGAECVAIPGATSASYTVAEADAGFTLRAFVTATSGSGSATASSAATAVVASAPAVALTGLVDGQTVSGDVTFAATALSGTFTKVEFLVDGGVLSTDTAAPYALATPWDTTTATNGAHTVAVRATTADGRVVSASAGVTVANVSLAVAHSGLASGQTVSGQVLWGASVSATGTTVSKVEFLVDGAVRSTDSVAPYELNKWDTTKESNGSHTLVVRATAADGRTASATITVTVSNATGQVSLTGVSNGQIVSGWLRWGASVTGLAVSRVEFLVDGRLRWTERSAPYNYKTNGVSGWDTTKESNGTHTLTARVVTTSGAVVTVSVNVTVSNK
jgi:hypothetical protein